MTVREMSALTTKILSPSTAVQNKQSRKHAGFSAAMSSPKAEVASSNLAGRAISDQWRKRAEVKRNTQRRLRVCQARWRADPCSLAYRLGLTAARRRRTRAPLQ
jgi:hypothetical protein